jgi:hypothetical protein
MFKKFLSLALAALLMQVVSAASVYADPKAEKEARKIEKIKAGIARLGIGPEARVEVKLRDETKIKGYISEVNEDSFVVVDSNTGATSRVTYPQVGQVKGNSLSTGAQTAIVAGFIAFFIILGLIASGT